MRCFRDICLRFSNILTFPVTFDCGLFVYLFILSVLKLTLPVDIHLFKAQCEILAYNTLLVMSFQITPTNIHNLVILTLTL